MSLKTGVVTLVVLASFAASADRGSAENKESKFELKPGDNVLRVNVKPVADRGFSLEVWREAKGGAAIHSHEIFGNKIDRVIGFRDGKVADFSGKPVVLEFEMNDADVYAFQFKE